MQNEYESIEAAIADIQPQINYGPDTDFLNKIKKRFDEQFEEKMKEYKRQQDLLDLKIALTSHTKFYPTFFPLFF